LFGLSFQFPAPRYSFARPVRGPRQSMLLLL